MRKDFDFYATPESCIKLLLDNYDLSNKGDLILEPSAGNGNVSKELKLLYPNKNITSAEIRACEKDNLELCSDEVIICDYLDYKFNKKFDIIIGNPPYTLAIEFVEKSLSNLTKNGVLIFLLRTAFLESKSRYNFWQKNPLTGLLTLSKRPSFTGKGTDATSYSWFVWDKSTINQFIKVI